MAVVSVIIGMIGLTSAGYCDLALQHSPTVPDISRGFTEIWSYKGHLRYLTASDYLICYFSTRFAFGGIGLALLLTFIRFLSFGHLPHR